MNPPLYRNINLYIIFAITFGGIVSVSILVPVLPAIAKRFALSPAEVGLVITLYTLPGVIFIPFMGAMADKFGRKALLVPSIIIFSVSGGAIYWVEDFFWLEVLRFVQGIGGASLPIMSTILIGDLFSEKLRLKVMGLNAAALSVGTAVFPAIGGLLAEKAWNVPFLAFWFGLILAFIVAFFLKEPEFKKTENVVGYLKSARKYLFTAKSFLVFLMGLFIFILLYGGVLTYLTLYMAEHFLMTPLLIGIYIAASSVASGAVAPLSARLARFMGHKMMLFIGFGLFALSFLSILFVPSYHWLIGTFLLFGSAMGMTLPLIQSIVASLSPVQYRGLLVSIFGMLIRLGQTVGPPVLAIALFFNGLSAVFITSIVISVFFMALVLAKGDIISEEEIG